MKNNSLHQKAVQTILHGHSCAMKLKLKLKNPMAENEHGSGSCHDLTKSILECFSNAISNLLSSDDHQSSDLSSTSSSVRPYKKRKINSIDTSEIWWDDSPNPVYYDGFLWRKYGQKHISKTNHQRSYYRCAYNKDDYCKARKQEQKIKDSPPVYRTTYFGHHTCKINHHHHHHHEHHYDEIDDLDGSRMIQFGKAVGQEEEGSIKKESVTGDYDQVCEHVNDEIQLSPSDCYPKYLCSSGTESTAFSLDLFENDLASFDSYENFDLGFY